MGPLTLLSPRALLLLVGLLPIVALYILKTKRARHVVSAVSLWAAAERDLRARHPFRRLRAEVPLLFESLVLIALAFALAEPALPGEDRVPTRLAIVFDVSASMATRDAPGERAGETRIHRARSAALSAVSGLIPGSEVMIVEAGAEARVLLPPERDRMKVRAAIERVDARAVEGRLSPAIALAADKLRAEGGGRLLVLSDGALAEDEPLSVSGVEVASVDVGRSAGNVAIVRAGARPSASAPGEVELFAVLRSENDARLDADVSVFAADDRPRPGDAREPIATRHVRLSPNVDEPIVFAIRPTDAERGRVVSIEVAVRGHPEPERVNALALDDRAYVHVPESDKLVVVLASDRRASWIEHAFASDDTIAFQRLTLDELAVVNVPPQALVVVEGACPKAVPGRDVVIVDPKGGECLGVRVDPAVASPPITSWDRMDPRLRFLSLDGVTLGKAHLLSSVSASGALVRTRDGVVMADASLPGRTATVVGFALEETDWPLRASFVVFLRNLVENARGSGDTAAMSTVRTSEATRLAVPPGTATVTLEGPNGPRELGARDGFVVLPPLETTGAYRVRWVEPRVGEAWLGATLASVRESRIAPRPLVIRADGERVVAHRDTPPLAFHTFAFLLAAAASVLVALELLWLTRHARRGDDRHRVASPPLAAKRRVPLGLVAWVGASALPLAYALLVHAGALPSHPLRFERPLALLLPCALGLVLAWRLPLLTTKSGNARRVALSASTAAAAMAAALSAAEPSWGAPLDRLTVVLAVDRSRSIDLVADAEARLARELQLAEVGMRERDRIAVVSFGARAATEDPARTRGTPPSPQRVSVPRDATDIEAAVRHALAEVPSDSGGRVVVLSDGIETRGDVLRAAALSSAASIPVDTVVLEQKRLPNVRVAEVVAPARTDEGAPFDLRVVTTSAEDAKVLVRVLRDGEPHREMRAELRAGEDVLRIRELAPGPGLHRYDVVVSAEDRTRDPSADDNEGAVYVRVTGPSLAMIVEESTAAAAPMAAALEGAGFRVDVRAKSAFPSSLAELAAFDLVVLGNVPTTDLDPNAPDRLAAFARDLGGGLLLLGGDRAMGPGGYARTAVEEVAPVSFDLREQKRRGSLAEVISIDYSGSMQATVSGGATKLALANEAAARSASLLGEEDRLGVSHVDEHVAWTIPLAPVRDAEAIGRAIRRVGAGGGGIFTDIALKAAYDALAPETTNLKHVLLFADGDDAEKLEGCRALVRAAASRRITTSVVSLGRGNDTRELEVLSRIGGGRFYLIEDATRLPSVFAQETVLATQSALVFDPFVPHAKAPSPALRGIDWRSAPPLGGYVVTRPKGRAAVHLEGPDGDPILATWSVGLGRAAAFMSDYRATWGRDWVGWEGGARLFAQLARDIARRAHDPSVELDARAQGGTLRMRLDARVLGDGSASRTNSYRSLSAHVAKPDGTSETVPLMLAAPGRYEASLEAARPGAYVVTVKDDARGEPIATTAAVLPAGDELRPIGSDRALLGRLAAVSGGRVRDTLAGVFDDRGAPRYAFVPLAPYLLVFAGVSLIAAVSARRLAGLERGRRKRTSPSEGEVAPPVARQRSAAAEPREAPNPPNAPSPHATPVPTELPATPPVPSAPRATPDPPHTAETSAETLARRFRNRR